MRAGRTTEPVVDPAAATPLPTRGAYVEALARVRAAAAAYHRGDETMADADYDALIATVTATERAHPAWRPADSPTGQVAEGAAPLGEVPHSSPMLSLDNVFDEASLRRWAARLEKLLGRPSAGFSVEPKIDGLAVAVRYRDGDLALVLTRGTGTTGEDVTAQARRAAGLPARLARPLTIEVRGEIYMTEADFAVANELRTGHGETPFAHPRGAAAGTLRAVDRAYEAPLSFLAYAAAGLEQIGRHSDAFAVLGELGVATVAAGPVGIDVCSDVDEVVAAVERIRDRRGELGFPTDGVVIKADVQGDRDAAGASSKAPRWAVAVKFPADVRTTKLLSIDVQVGRTGVLTPVATLAPVVIDGVTVVSATLHNFDDLVRRDVRVGDTVFVRRAGDVIPEVTGAKLDERAADAKAFVPPEECPRCGAGIDRSQRRWRCASGLECGARMRLAYYATREAMDVEGLGEKIIDQLVAAGLVTDVADLYDLTVADLVTLDRLGELSATKLVAAIDRTRGRPLSALLTGLGIRMAGRAVSRAIARHFGDLATLRTATAADLEKIDGIGPTRAAVIAEDLATLDPVLAKMIERGVALTEPVADAGAEAPLRGPDGTPMRVVVTGAVPGLPNREAGNAAVARLGGIATGSVSAKTDLVVVGEGAGSKAEKAAALGVRVVPADRFAAALAAYEDGDAAGAAGLLAATG